MRKYIRSHFSGLALWIASSFAGALALLFLFLFWMTGGAIQPFTQFIKGYLVIRRDFYQSVPEKTLFQGAISGMVSSLEDPYSKVLIGDRYTSFLSQTTGEYSGIGIALGETEEGQPIILAVFPESSAEASGLQAGDLIQQIDGNDLSGLTTEDVAAKVRGTPGTSLTMGILRNGAPQTYVITRSTITLPTVQSFMAAKGIGYVRIFQFGTHTPEEVKKSLDALRKKGMEKLIIDLRRNPGGLIDSVVEVANQLLSKGTVVSYHEKSGHVQTYTISGIEKLLPMVMLMDSSSASASEILAGAAQDKGEATIMGETSFGKGTVQSVIPYGEQEAIKISIAEYKTPKGRSINHIGIVPDMPVVQTGTVFNPADDSVYNAAIEYLSKQGNT
ncbi:MAG: S41 family peptidase [Dialister sp.]|nr:S41 family peptidase [Dialister sp.]